MRITTHLLAAALLLLIGAPALRAQSAPDISGHWEGRFDGPLERTFEVDFMRTGNGYTGTIGIPAEDLKGLPITKLTLTGTSIYFRAREDQPFNGYVSPDGKLMTGDMSLEGFSVPASLTRTGEARTETVAPSAAIAPAFEGTWSATIGGTRIALKLTNEADGTVTGRLINLNQGNLEIPASAISQSASALTFELKAIHGSYSGTLNQAGTELVGNFTEGSRTAPLTFTHATTK